jgi:hypothetical protein
MTVRLTTDLAGLNRLIDQLGTDVEAAARPAAQAAAQVFYDGVVANVNALGTVTGNLRRAIYQAFSPENSGPGRASYNVSWNERKAPHGHLVEYGHVQRYVVYLNKKGEWKTKIRPEMLGKRSPAAGQAKPSKTLTTSRWRRPSKSRQSRLCAPPLPSQIAPAQPLNPCC